VVTGSLKAGAATEPAGGLTLAGLGVAGKPVLVAASTHAGEEEAILAAWRRIVAVAGDACLVLAPRRPERFDDVATMLRQAELRFWRRSDSRDGVTAWPAGVPILLLDSLGELSGLFAGARVAFVGGTLVPRGGHNVLEPAAAGTAVVFGPSIDTTRVAAERLLAAGAGLQISDAAELAATLERLFADPAETAAMGRRARTLVERDEGPLAVTLAIVRGTLGASPTVEHR
jgi:3-deoxy-D-manno-octulosonic-acid transferase